MTKTELIKLKSTLSDNECFIVITESGTPWILIDNILVNDSGYNYLSSYNEDLTLMFCNIIKVYKSHYGNGVTAALNLKYSTLIWERSEIVELTMDQIAEKFGVNVENLKIKK